MGDEKDETHELEGDHVIHDHPVPPEELGRYSPVRDSASEADIANYVMGQAPDETVSHVEKIKTEYVLGDPYEIWDVTTDKNRWWVLTNMTNLYSQQHFPSLDYTLSFHIGLMMRLRSRTSGPDAADPNPFVEVVRRQDQVHDTFERALETQDFQAVGMQLRENLLVLARVVRTHVDISDVEAQPQAANFKGWADLLIGKLCPGGSNEDLRKFLRGASTSLWDLVSHLTHATGADTRATAVAVHAADTLIGHFFHLTEKAAQQAVVVCRVCSSRNIRTHYDVAVGEDGAYFHTCGQCGWTDHPGE